MLWHIIANTTIIEFIHNLYCTQYKKVKVYLRNKDTTWIKQLVDHNQVALGCGGKFLQEESKVAKLQPNFHNRSRQDLNRNQDQNSNRNIS